MYWSVGKLGNKNKGRGKCTGPVGVGKLGNKNKGRGKCTGPT